nr:uncharacterized protein LOC128697773 isoform X1 [Cherax quadricarinatus]
MEEIDIKEEDISDDQVEAPMTNLKETQDNNPCTWERKSERKIKKMEELKQKIEKQIIIAPVKAEQGETKEKMQQITEKVARELYSIGNKDKEGNKIEKSEVLKADHKKDCPVHLYPLRVLSSENSCTPLVRSSHSPHSFSHLCDCIFSDELSPTLSRSQKDESQDTSITSEKSASEKQLQMKLIEAGCCLTAECTNCVKPQTRKFYSFPSTSFLLTMPTQTYTNKLRKVSETSACSNSILRETSETNSLPLHHENELPILQRSDQVPVEISKKCSIITHDGSDLLPTFSLQNDLLNVEVNDSHPWSSKILSSDKSLTHANDNTKHHLPSYNSTEDSVLPVDPKTLVTTPVDDMSEFWGMT